MKVLITEARPWHPRAQGPEVLWATSRVAVYFGRWQINWVWIKHGREPKGTLRILRTRGGFLVGEQEEEKTELGQRRLKGKADPHWKLTTGSSEQGGNFQKWGAPGKSSV